MCERNMTNRERLEKMTDEELAVEICNWFERSCESCPAYKSNMCKFGGGYGNGLLKWLKAEAEEEA